MSIQTKFQQLGIVALLALATVQVHAQNRPAPSIQNVDVGVLIEQVARTTGKTFIVDPRVRAQVTLYGIDAANLDYDVLIEVLDVHGFTAIGTGKIVRIVPSADARLQPVPTIAGSRRFADSEMVNKVIPVKSTSAAQLVPILRPMLPQYAHLAASNCTNSLVVVDRFANVQRILAIVDAMDKGEPLAPPPCKAGEPN